VALATWIEPREKRTQVFRSGYDVYGPLNARFDIQSAETPRTGFRFDTRLKGHLYGAALRAGDKQALLEYMKTS